MSANKLTAKQERFVAEYLIDLNATAAYKRAGYEATGHAAEANAHRMLRNAEVAKAIAAAQAKLSQRTEVTAAWVIERLQAEAEFDGEGASPAARVSALKALGEHLGMFVKRLKVEGEQTLRIKHVIVEPGPNGPVRRTGTAPDTNGFPVQPQGV